MATITAGTLIGQAWTIAQDTGGVRWPPAEMLGWLNAGQIEAAVLKPEVSTVNVSVLLAAGLTKQALPVGGTLLMRVSRNMGVAGTTPGLAIRVVDRAVFDATIPTWHTDANAAGVINHYMYDPLDPKTYYVYPQAPTAALYVELVYAAVPAAATITVAAGAITASSVISIDDIYSNALLDYILYRAYSKDATYARNAQIAVAHYTAFANSITCKAGTDVLRSPTVAHQG